MKHRCICMALVVILFSGCGRASDSNFVKLSENDVIKTEFRTETEEVSSEETTSEIVVPDGTEMEKTENLEMEREQGAFPEMEINVQLITELEDKLSHTTVLGDVSSEYNAKILLKINQTVSDFKFWEISSDIDEDGNLSLSESNVIGEVQQLDADQEIVVAGDLGETFPLKGISFKDQEGNIYHYYLGLSGYDGSAMIEAYELKE